jgi:hypothetical protein
MKKKTLLPLLFLYSFATNTALKITSQKIDSLMEDALAKFKVAAAIAIVKDGKVIHQKDTALLLSKQKNLSMKILTFK